MSQRLRVALVNDYEIVLEGLSGLLRTRAEVEVVEFDIRRKPRRRVDITLLDTYGELEVLTDRVRSLSGDPTNGMIVVFSFSDHRRAVHDAIDAGAQGFISKAIPANEIVEGIIAVGRGDRVVLTQRSRHAAMDERIHWPGRDIGLTERESELLSLLPTGMTNREIGAHLYVSENTVKTQLRHLYAKIQVRNRAQAASFAGLGILGVRRGPESVDSP